MVLVESKVNLMSESHLVSEARGASAERLVSKALVASKGALGVYGAFFQARRSLRGSSLPRSRPAGFYGAHPQTPFDGRPLRPCTAGTIDLLLARCSL